jgi:hypothetical protein
MVNVAKATRRAAAIFNIVGSSVCIDKGRGCPEAHRSDTNAASACLSIRQAKWMPGSRCWLCRIGSFRSRSEREAAKFDDARNAMSDEDASKGLLNTEEPHLRRRALL